jgi:hypothetical protein
MKASKGSKKSFENAKDEFHMDTAASSDSDTEKYWSKLEKQQPWSTKVLLRKEYLRIKKLGAWYVVSWLQIIFYFKYAP